MKLVPSIATSRNLEIRPETITVSIFGVTGSIGNSAAEIIENHPSEFTVHTIVSGTDPIKLATMIAKLKPKYAALANVPHKDLRIELDAIGAKHNCEIQYGEDAIVSLASSSAPDVVLHSIVGFSGIRSVLATLKAGRRVLLANKESLVSAGHLVADACSKYGGDIVPVDSEHSAIYQLLLGSAERDIEQLILTASGGPFRNLTRAQLAEVTVENALKHPTWNMGPKITIDSATLFNKALEVIEAAWLFGLTEDKISVIVHPKSIVHSLIEFCDGVQLAQLSHPDMKGPISFALNFPYGRIPNAIKRLDLREVSTLEFYPLDDKLFPAVSLAKACLKSGGLSPAVLNIANEVAVSLFLNRKISFSNIYDFVAKSLDIYGGRGAVKCEDELFSLKREIEEIAGDQHLSL